MGKSSIGGHNEIERILRNGPYRNFVKYTGNPINPPAQTWEQWDGAGNQEDPKIITVGNTRYMFYCALNDDGHMNIGLRTQSLTDPPQTWTPHENNPVLSHAESGWASVFVAAPHVIAMQDGSYRMYFHGYGPKDGLSADRGGVATCSAANFPGGPWVMLEQPIFDVGATGAWDCGFIHPEIIVPPWVPVGSYHSVSSDGLWHMVYGGGNADGSVWSGGHATSPDGLSWTRDPLNPVWIPNSASGFDGISIHPVGQPILINGLHHILYQGCNTTLGFSAIWTIGVAATRDFRTFVHSPRNPLLMPGTYDSGSIENPGVVFDPLAGTLDLYYVSMPAPADFHYVMCTARSTFAPFTP